MSGVPAVAQAFGASFTVGSSGGSGTGTVTYSATGSCGNSGTTVNMTSGTGICSVTATKAADLELQQRDLGFLRRLRRHWRASRSV